MISRILALNYRCLRFVDRPLDGLHILVGPNGSGKSAFLDVVAVLARLVADGLDAALEERGSDLRDLIWRGGGRRLELALELRIPEERRSRLGDHPFPLFRYQVAIGVDGDSGEPVIEAETGLLRRQPEEPELQQGRLFPEVTEAPETILLSGHALGTRTVFSKVPGGNDNFYREASADGGRSWAPVFRLGPRRSALANLPADESSFPVATWVRDLLSRGVRRLSLDGRRLRAPSPPGQGHDLQADGGNLPWVVHRLEERHPEGFLAWLDRVRVIEPGIETVSTVEQAADRHRHLTIGLRGGGEIPSWNASEGTLRLLALTLLPHLPDLGGTWLIEEPETGLDPGAAVGMLRSLTQVEGTQLLVATHSPAILGAADARSLLCFSKTEGGETRIVPGSEHPALSAWKSEIDREALLARGILG
ncbi:MAG: AAA family ATPase [Planctomycetota bacterium]